MVTFLAVDIRLDVLKVEHPLTVAREMADFRRLPYFDGTGDANANVSYLSQNHITPPFQDRDLLLKRGAYLHWSLPSPLTHGRYDHKARRIVFPPVPNRWLITRTTKPEATPKSWIVESDYLYPPDEKGMAEGLRKGAITYPIHSDPTASEPPFRFIGRAVPLKEWNRTGDGDYLPLSNPLTAIGYGDPTFAAFFPSCRSVFGFYDDELWRDAEYSVIGWYSSIALESSAAALVDDLDGWALDVSSATRLVCCAASGEVIQPNNGDVEVQVIVGNTATEALSAYLAHQHNRDNQVQDPSLPSSDRRSA